MQQSVSSTAKRSVEKDVDVGRNSLQVFGHLLQGLIRDKWSGTITFSSSDWKKRIHLEHGNFSFASSNLVEDRLGEIMYRRDMITLDQLTDASVKIERNIKFGQVLLRDKTLSNEQLWDALKVQVISIIKSLFLNERVSYMIQRTAPAMNNFVLIDDSYNLVEIFKIHNSVFLNFCAQVDDNTVISVSDKKHSPLSQGCYYGDLLELIRPSRTIGEIIKSSKVNRLYTLAAVVDLLNMNVCTVDEAHYNPDPLRAVMFHPIKKAVDTYHILLKMAMNSFRNHGCEGAIAEICHFSRSLGSCELNILTLDFDGEISIASQGRMANHCILNTAKIEFYSEKIWMIVRFLLQAAIDTLPAVSAKPIVQKYRDLIVEVQH